VSNVFPPVSWRTSGYTDIIDEYGTQASPRAKKYMEQLIARVASLPKHQQEAIMVTDLVELDIRMSKDQKYLGLPVDVVQLGPSTGLHWVQRKKSCHDN